MSSILITSTNRLSNSNYYQIPPTIAFTTARIKQAVIQNSYNNATNQSYTVTSGNTVITIPIENGYYEGTDYADYLTQQLNAYTKDSLGLSWTVAFKASTQKFYVRCQNTSSTDAKLTPNAPASKTSGIPETVFPANNDVSIEQDNNRAYLDPTFYTVCSRSVPQAMMGYGVSLSDIVAVCPVSDGLNSVYQCNDSVFPVASQVQYLYNQIDIRIYLEDTSEELPDAVFAIELELR